MDLEDISVRITMFALVALAMIAAADNFSDREKLLGSWQPQQTSAKEAGAWMIESKGADVWHITHSVGDQKLLEFECSTMGRDCEAKESGKPAKVSMWFNGPKLVELETKGKEVVKRRFAVAGEGDTLEIEVIPIEPAGKTETLRFRRLQK
jgi:hypothetical protein